MTSDAQRRFQVLAWFDSVENNEYEPSWIPRYNDFLWNATAEQAIEYLRTLEPDSLVHVLQVPATKTTVDRKERA